MAKVEEEKKKEKIVKEVIGKKVKEVSEGDGDSEIEEIPRKKAAKKKVVLTKEGKTKVIKKPTPTKAKSDNKKSKKSKKSAAKNGKSSLKPKSKKIDEEDEEEGGLDEIDPDLIMPG